ncbi:MAG: HIT domain-containing protein [Anaerolineaceae bacterium]|nr:HIT domain-containing protein [Anaerolineaceae bacterium]MDD4042057.1 HIT domain-containing protein [Anaerolineaceae bacterium]MDD4578035.1 HIT domain-containing protein [Anaerolineaceae bacterium]
MENCIFCAIAAKQVRAAIVLESDTCMAFLDNNPITPYHTLVIPKAHYRNMIDVPVMVLQDLTELMHQVCQIYAQKLGIDSFQIFNNAGPHSAQTVWHLHFHVLPRYGDDAIKFLAHRNPELVTQYPEMLEKLK